MATSRQKKEGMFQTLEEWLSKTKSLVLIDYYGLKVKEINQLRKNLTSDGCKYLVTKKTLFKKALEKIGIKGIDWDKLVGGIGLAISPNDEVAPARILMNFQKEHEKMKIHGGIFNQAFIGPVEVKNLSVLPSKDELIAKVVWTIKAPLQNMVGVMHGNLRQLVYALQAVVDKKK